MDIKMIAAEAIRLVKRRKGIFNSTVAKYVIIIGVTGNVKSMIASKKDMYMLSLPFGDSSATIALA